MTPTDFVLSIIASILANKVGSSSDTMQNQNAEKRAKELFNNTEITDIENTSNISKSCFISFDQDKIFEYIPLLDEPRIHILFESEPSTFYHLPAIVLECIKTRQWYVFRRGRIAAEGTGGGWNNFKGYVDSFKKQNINCCLWLIEKNLLDDLEDGVKLWPEVSSLIIPLLATKLSHLNDRFNEIK
ncbi:hypothetical protein [Neisseria animaloris]|uniref:hypothetical protein n=1 Tax=Neisseria animaloris TaxID=326522 RepID=UPI000D3069D9|nr:hypothetical protein [Neisseria animaloris]